MFDFHSDKDRYFDIQKTVTKEDIIPFLQPLIKKKEWRVLEIGCAEAGVLKAFLDDGHQAVGVELSQSRFELAKKYLHNEIKEGRAKIINKNIYDIDPKSTFPQLFDLIVLKDVIEHIPNQEIFIPKLKEFLVSDGLVFFAYPPWWMPFGGHQQMCSSKWLRVFPWIHLLPNQMYSFLLKWMSEKPGTIAELLEIKSTGINIERLYRILKENDFVVKKESFWFTNPIYKFKFGVKKRHLLPFLSKIPYMRNFYTTAHYVVFGMQ